MPRSRESSVNARPLRTTAGGAKKPALAAAPPPEDGGFDTIADLVATVIAATELLPQDRLAAVRGRAGTGTLAQAIADEGYAQSDGVARALARRHGLAFLDLGETRVSPNAIELIPLRTLQRVVAIPVALVGDRLRVAVADPANIHGIDELRVAARHSVEFVVASREDILTEIERVARQTEVLETQTAIEELQVDEADGEEALEVDDGVSDAPLVRLVNSIIMQAAGDGASDIHFEAQEDALSVRTRVDGVLTETQRIPKRMAAGVTTRLKVLSKLDIAERRKPQDGRISLNARSVGRMLDIRVAVLPTVEGEQVVMRLIDKSRTTPTLESLGLSETMRATLSSVIRKPTGALLVTGPTGSGKSTTLYAALAEINHPDIKIITVEDPVEYRLTGINQIQINIKAGLTFATALRTILRSDPDVIMVGEIRDTETAKISIESALTGHFVFSTLHTNDAPGAITRLNEMGVEPFLTGSAVSAVLAQRLARRLCTNCCEMYVPTMDELVAARLAPEDAAAREGMALYRKVGCPRCNRTGYKGRIGIFQLLVMNDELEGLAAGNASRDAVERAAMEAGMRSLWDDGIAKAAAGLTSIEELTRVVTM
jgi:type IV pilus assembly protein PilB